MKVEVDNQGGSYALTAAVLIYTDSAYLPLAWDA
jgi:hypothetical protein